MPTTEEYKETLDALAALLRKKGPLTALAIAALLKCSKPAAYQRLDALKARGEDLFKKKIRESATGPKSVAYGIR